MRLSLVHRYGRKINSSCKGETDADNSPFRLLAGIPLCALFVLFDQVIDEPHRADTRSNLALLDIAGGHFSRIEYVSEGSLPGSLIAEFAYIARDYVNEVKRQPLDLSSLPPNGNGAVQRPNSGSVNPNTNETMEGYSDGNNFLVRQFIPFTGFMCN